MCKKYNQHFIFGKYQCFKKVYFNFKLIENSSGLEYVYRKLNIKQYLKILCVIELLLV